MPGKVVFGACHVAAELADGGWDAFDVQGFPVGAPTCGLPLYRVWGMEEVGVFWDFCSLHQNPPGGKRTSQEAELFKLGLPMSNIWYGHARTDVWMQPQLPEGFRFAEHLAQVTL